MLIHKLAKEIKYDTDTTIGVDIREHPFSGVQGSQILLTFKEQRLKVSIVQMSDAAKLYVCIIGRKMPHSAGESYEWKEIWFKPDTNDKYVPQIWAFVKKMVDNSDKFRGKTLPISYKEAIACLSKQQQNKNN